MAGKFADHTKYHLSPKGFWKKFRDVAVLNPNISSGLPIASINRYPQPGSRPEKYATPATKASDPAFNRYWARDTRRAYPQLSTVTQSSLTKLLLASPELQAQVAPPKSENDNSDKNADEKETSSVPALPSPLPDLTVALSQMSSAKKVFAAADNRLPPSPPYTWRGLKKGDSIPHDPHDYFPMELYK